MIKERTRRIARAGYVAADRRTPLSETAQGMMRKAFPDHWSFLLGELALYSLVVLVLTGSFLALYFDPSMKSGPYFGSYSPLRGLTVSQAYASTVHISFDVRGGLLIRQMHHWAALIFVAALGVHMLRVFFTGAFRRPREVNWMVGVTLFLLALLEGFCGYSLPDDLLSGTGMRTANTIVMSLPVVGTYLSQFLWGGSFPGQAVLPRLYIVHVLFVPALLIGLVLLHLMMVVYLKHTQWSAPGKTNRNAVGQPMFPHFAAKSAGLSLMVAGVTAFLGATAQINPVWSYGPFRGDQVSLDSQPDWYVGFLEGALRLMPPWENEVAGHTLMWNVLIPAVLLPGLLFLVLYLYPFFEKWVTGDEMEHHLCDRPRDRPTRTGLGVGAVVFYAVLLMAGGNDVTALVFRVSVETLTWILRIALVAGPVIAYLVTKRVCLALQARERQLMCSGTESGRVEQNVYGAISESHRSLDVARRYRALVRDIPRPLSPPGSRATRVARVRSLLSRWYYRDRVHMPMTADQRAQIEERLKEPVGDPEMR
jgi:ubiquinol-cytochrome c reductase cytochrome b subunit